MLVITTSAELKKIIERYKYNNETIAFVPTMGNLHQGHLSLVSIAQQHASITIVSLFVNPLQFNQTEDLHNYPRTLEDDIDLCTNNDVDILFTPAVNDMYPDGDATQPVELPELHILSTTLEGASRPDHFSGVITIVKKLFEMVRPDIAIFGEKDFQQFLIIKEMVRILNFPIRIIGAKTLREQHGLAMSSRNNNLQTEQRQRAALVYKVLNSIRYQIVSGNNNYAELSTNGAATLNNAGFRLDYLEICSSSDLRIATVDDIDDRVILIAVWLGNTRLIDNLRV